MDSRSSSTGNSEKLAWEPPSTSVRMCGKCGHIGQLWRQLYLIWLGAIPLGVVAGLALGFVVWIHLHGAVPAQYSEHVPGYVALAVVLEHVIREGNADALEGLIRAPAEGRALWQMGAPRVPGSTKS